MSGPNDTSLAMAASEGSSFTDDRAAVSAAQAPSHGFYIPSLDGIRAISFALVFFSHEMLSGFIPGGFGVTVFFFLSGFLITTLLRMEHEATGKISLKKFYLRRALRIFPPMYLSIALALAVMLLNIAPGKITTQQLLFQLFHLSNYYELYGDAPLLVGTGVLWSLAVEEHFYLIFPLFYMGLLRFTQDRTRQAWIVLGVCALVLLWRIILIHHFHVPAFVASHTIDSRADSILFGSVLAIVGNPTLDKSKLGPRGILLLAAVSLVLLMGTIVARDADFKETFRYTLQGICLAPLFIASVRLHDRWPFRALNWRWVRFVGVLSYSLYLFHYICIKVFAQIWPEPQGWSQMAARAALSLVVSFVLAWIVHELVEKPCAELRKRLSSVKAPAIVLAEGRA